MFKFLWTYNVILVAQIFVVIASIPDKRLCANHDCTEKISLAVTINRYGADDPRKLSFGQGEIVTVYSKTPGSKQDLWGVEINGKTGYVPHQFLRENKIYTKNLKFEKDTAENVHQLDARSQTSQLDEKPTAAPVVKASEIIDGTIFYSDNLTPVQKESTVTDNANNENSNTENNIVGNQNPPSDIKVEDSSVNAEDASNNLTLIQKETEPLKSTAVNNENVNTVNTDDNKISTSDNELQDSAVSTEDNNSEVVSRDDDDNIEISEEEGVLDHIAKDAQIEENVSTETVFSNEEAEINNIKSDDLRNSEKKDFSSEPKYPFNAGYTTETALNVSNLENDSNSVESTVTDSTKTPSINSAQNDALKVEEKVTSSTHKLPLFSLDSNSGSVPLTDDNSKDVEVDDNISKNFSESIQENLSEKSNLESSENLKKVEVELPTDKIQNTEQSEKPKEGITGKREELVIEEEHKNVSVDNNYSKLPPADESSSTKIPIPSPEPHSHNAAEHPKDKISVPGIEIPPLSYNVVEPVMPDSPASINTHIHSLPTILSSKKSIEVQTTDDVSNSNKYDVGSPSPFPIDDNQHLPVVEGAASDINIEDGEEGEENDTDLENTESETIEGASTFIPKVNEDLIEEHVHDLDGLLSKTHVADDGSCLAGFHESDCPQSQKLLDSSKQTNNENMIDFTYFQLPLLAYEVILVLIISAVTVLIFLWGYIYIDRRRKEAPLVAKINSLQKQFLLLKKENELLTEKVYEEENDSVSKVEAATNEIVEELRFQLVEAENFRISLEIQVQNLEKELENSTEVGLELNRMLSEFLNSDSGSEGLIANIDQLQRQLIEQQGTINTYNETLSIKETEIHELRLELKINNTRVIELQSELNKMAINLLKLEEEKEMSQSNYETDLATLKKQLNDNATTFKSDISKMSEELHSLKKKYEVSQRNFEMKSSEYKILKENFNKANSDNTNSDVLQAMFDTTSMKAELLQLRNENKSLNEQLQQEGTRTTAFEKQAYLAMEDAQQLKIKYDNSDREKTEAQTKLEILSNYFKDREAQLQKELSKQESMWVEKQGEANSTTERIKYMQDELQNYKAQYESLKQEIVAQEVDMKSQISILEKKAHENWVSARQAERKLEEAKQESAQLRNRLTLRERSLNDDKGQNRVISPLEQNGDLSLNDTGASLPLMFGSRDHLTTSPPLPSLPHFLPPPPGVPFMPPPIGGVPLPPPGFLPPPPSMIPGDHRPPPLGRMSSPPLNSRYSPDSRGYSPYSRNSPSPTSDDEYDRPVYRSYSPYNREDRREFTRPPPPPTNRNSIRNHRGTHSSGSAHSNESLEKINRHNSKV